MNIFYGKKYNWLIYAFPLAFVLMPRPSIDGVHMLTYPAIAFLLSVLILTYMKKVNLTKSLLRTYQFGFFLAFFMALSILLNGSGYTAVIHMAKIVLFLVILTFGYLIGKAYKDQTIVSGLLKVSYIVILVQLVIASCQFFGVGVFDPLYSSDKTRAFGSLVRVAGSLGNPNMFGWVITQMGIVVFLFEEKKFKKIFTLILCFALVVASGSRSMLLLFPFVFLVTFVLTNRKNVMFYLIKFPISLVMIGAFGYISYQLLLTYGSHFPYVNQLLSVFDSKSLESINSYYLRTVAWENALGQLGGVEKWYKWLLGLGPGAIEVADNDFIYSIANYGLIFSILQYSMYVLFILYFLMCGNIKLKALGIQYILFSLALGVQSDTLGGWNFPLFCMFYAGIAIALIEKNKIKRYVEHKKKVYN